MKILVTDDNHDIADTIATFLRLCGHEVVAVYDGPSALSVIDEFLPDAAVLDISMPGMTGYELAQRIRANAATAAIRIVAVTGQSSFKERDLATDAGFDSYLVKPVSPYGILEALEEQDAPLVQRSANDPVLAPGPTAGRFARR